MTNMTVDYVPFSHKSPMISEKNMIVQKMAHKSPAVLNLLVFDDFPNDFPRSVTV